MSNPIRLPMLRLTLRNLFSSPRTRRYPAEVRPPLAGFRGQLEVDIGSCVLCGICDRRCPCGAITVSRDEKTLVLEPLRCTACGICVDACNKHSLRLTPETLQVQLGPAGHTRLEFHKP
jgi:ech hydrogenase subunit F